MLSSAFRIMLVVATLCHLSQSAGVCSWLEKQDRAYQSMFQVFSGYTIEMLRKMGVNDPQSRPTEFPDRPYNHVMHLTAEEKVVFLTETLKEVEHVFSSGGHESTSWHQSDIDRFMNDIFRQNTELKHCVTEMKLSPSALVSRASKKIKLHFKILRKTLKEKAYSGSAWDDVRTVLLAHMLRLDVLADSIQHIRR